MEALWPLWVLFLLDVVRYLGTDLLVCAAELRGRARAFRQPAPAPTRGPLVSVIMAGHNEADTMPLTLASLREQTYEDLEIIVVDDGSSDGTAAAVTAQLRGPYLVGPGGVDGRRVPCRLVRLDRRNGKAGALNLGLLLSRGEIIVYVDADTTFDRDAIANIVRPMLADPTVGAVGGNLVVRNGQQNLLARVVSLEYLFSIGIGRRFRSQVNLLHVISGAFGAFRRDLVESVGGHAPTSGNDGDLTLKVRRLSRICFAHDALCLTKSPVTIMALIRQRRRWDRNLIKNKLRRHRDILDPRSVAFRPANALLILDALLFNMVLGLRWLLAFLYALFTRPQALPAVLLVAYLLELGLSAAQLMIAHWLQPTPPATRRSHWLHLPLYPIYKAGFRLVRLYAYAEELGGHASYADAFAPPHVSAEALSYDHRGKLGIGAFVAGQLWPFRFAAQEPAAVKRRDAAHISREPPEPADLV